MGSVIFKCGSCSGTIIAPDRQVKGLAVCTGCGKTNYVRECSVERRCPDCFHKLLISSDFLGGAVRCPVCKREVDLEDNGDAEIKEESGTVAEIKAVGIADILFKCPDCGKSLAVNLAGVDKMVPCPDCGSSVLVPEPISIFKCPSCTWDLAAPEGHAGEVFACPSCEEQVVVPEPPPTPEPPPRMAEESPPGSDEPPPPMTEESPPGSEEPHCKPEKPEPNSDVSEPIPEQTGNAPNEQVQTVAQPEIVAKCPKCDREDVPFVCPNCEKSSGGMELDESSGVVTCFCGIETDRIKCPDCGATILSKFFRHSRAGMTKCSPSDTPELKPKSGQTVSTETDTSEQTMGPSGEMPCASCGKLIKEKVWRQQDGKCGACIDGTGPLKSRTSQPTGMQAGRGDQAQEPSSPSEKIPCKKCSAMILPATAKRTGGLCMPCAQDIGHGLTAQLFRQRSSLTPTQTGKLSPYSILVIICILSYVYLNGGAEWLSEHLPAPWSDEAKVSQFMNAWQSSGSRASSLLDPRSHQTKDITNYRVVSYGDVKQGFDSSPVVKRTGEVIPCETYLVTASLDVGGQVVAMDLRIYVAKTTNRVLMFSFE
jgi:DNA-directed RNA polymerase subunit RPC12/RpoP